MSSSEVSRLGLALLVIGHGGVLLGIIIHMRSGSSISTHDVPTIGPSAANTHDFEEGKSESAKNAASYASAPGRAAPTVPKVTHKPFESDDDLEVDNVSKHVPEVNTNVDNADDRFVSIRPIDIRQAQPLGWEAGIEVFTGGDPFLAMIHAIAVEQGYSKGALAVLMSDLPESMLDVKALPTKHHRLALDAEVKEAREVAETKAALGE